MDAHEPALRAVRVPHKGAFYTFLAVVVVAEIAAIVARAQGVHLPPPAFWWPLYALAPVLAWSAVPRQRREGRVRVDGKAVTLNGATLAKREELAMGLVRREGSATWLRLSGKSKWSSKMLDVAVENADEAEKILGLLGLDAKSRTAVFSVLTEKGRPFVLSILLFGILAGAGIGGMLIALHALPPFLIIAMMLALCFGIVGASIAAVRVQRATITVGVDGLRIDEGFKKPRFVPHDAIREVGVDGGVLRLTLADGARLGYRCGNKQRRRNGEGEDQKLAEAIADKVRAARAAFDDLAGDIGNVPALARSRRSTRDWLEALRRVADGEGSGYREGVVPRDRLLRVAESTHAPEKARLAAAVALAATATAEEKERLAAVASASASKDLEKRLRIAIDPTAEAAKLEQMLDEADDDVPLKERSNRR